ncbi:MAG: T9SS type A sorting domain-containing protein, partial [Flavobacteriaceae bacterium]|nr:T9SS type A sorting domain-containing protein [Flavobacteriaceae bacterium]
TVFPNPAEKELLLWISTESQSASIKLLGLDGRVISSLNALSLNDSTLRIPIEQLASGSYRILVQTPTEQINLPFIKQ